MFKKKQSKPIQNILIIRFSSIGDIVLTTPIIRCVKQKYPNATLHFLTKKSFGSILKDNPHVDVVHELSENLNDNIESLKKLNIDVVIDLHNNLRTLRVKKALKIKDTYTFNKVNIKKWLYVNLKIDVLPDVSIVERYFEPAHNIGVYNDGNGLDYFIPEDKLLQPDDIPMSHWSGYVACVIGGSFETKQFPAAKWIELFQLCKYPIILVGGPEDRPMGEVIAAMDPIRIYNSCGKFKLFESAELVKNAKVVVSNDTGLMHVAAAFKKNLISLWGNTTPELGMFPYYGANNLKNIIAANSTIIENKSLSCRPCSKIGYHECPKKHFKCMNEINVEKISTSIVNYWS